ncbi:MAG: SRPBCC family protein [Acidimicrobiales bacterium]
MKRPDAEETVEITAPAAEVWALRLDFNRLAEYNPDVDGVTRERAGQGVGGALGAGARYRFTLSTAHGPHPVVLTVTAVEDGRTVSAVMDGAMQATEIFEVTSLGARHCRAELALWLELPDGLSDDVAAGIVEGGRRQIRGELDRMRAMLSAPTVPT